MDIGSDGKDGSTLKPNFSTIIDNLDFVKPAGQNDVSILFVAGHGVSDPGGDFYFLPSDASIQDDGRPRRSRAISGRELLGILDHPGKKILFLGHLPLRSGHRPEPHSFRHKVRRRSHECVTRMRLETKVLRLRTPVTIGSPHVEERLARNVQRLE